MSRHVDFPRVTLLKVVKKYLLRPEHFIIGLKTTGHGRKYPARRMRNTKGVLWWSTLSAKTPFNPGRTKAGPGRGVGCAARPGARHAHCCRRAGSADRAGRLPFPIDLLGWF